MDRVDQLTMDYLEGTLPPVEGQELADHLQTDPAALRRLLDFYTQDRLLVELHRSSDDEAIQAIMAEIRREESNFAGSIMQRVRGLQASRDRSKRWALGTWMQRLRGGWLAWAACIALVATVLYVSLFRPVVGEPVLLATQPSDVILERKGQEVLVSQRWTLQPDDLLTVRGTNAVAITYLPENTRLELKAGATLKLLDWAHGKYFELRLGRMEASVAPQRVFKPLRIRTSRAEVRVLGTRFTLAVDANSTRLAVIEGKVKFTRLSDGKHLNVGAGSNSVAAVNYEFAALPATGQILREYWTNLAKNSLNPAGGTLKAKRSVAMPPDGFGYLQRFQSVPLAPGLHFTERIRGYVHPPINGLYRFALTTVHVETVLLLSRTDRPQDVVQVAFQTPDSRVGPSLQNVTPVPLEAGHKYYIEVVHESDGGDDPLTVMWQMPEGQPEIVPGQFLSPFPTPSLKGK